MSYAATRSSWNRQLEGASFWPTQGPSGSPCARMRAVRGSRSHRIEEPGASNCPVAFFLAQYFAFVATGISPAVDTSPWVFTL